MSIPRPLRSWPTWMLQSMIKFRRRKTMWLDAYEELLMRGGDYAEAYAETHDNVWMVGAPPGIH